MRAYLVILMGFYLGNAYADSVQFVTEEKCKEGLSMLMGVENRIPLCNTIQNENFTQCFLFAGGNLRADNEMVTFKDASAINLCLMDEYRGGKYDSTFKVCYETINQAGLPGKPDPYQSTAVCAQYAEVDAPIYASKDFQQCMFLLFNLEGNRPHSVGLCKEAVKRKYAKTLNCFRKTVEEHSKSGMSSKIVGRTDKCLRKLDKERIMWLWKEYASSTKN